MKKYFKVKYGFSATDYVSIEEGRDLDKAIYARFTGKPVEIAGKIISGSNIIVIEPHYHKYTGWNEWYEPKDPDDFKQIQKDCPSFDGIVEAHKVRVSDLINSGRVQEIGTVEYIYLPENKDKENLYLPGVEELSKKFKI
jgi:hypothetical protein